MKSLENIYFGSLTDSNLNELLTSDRFESAKKVIITDENVHEHWGESLISQFSGLDRAEIIVLPPGEAHKSLEICAQVWGALSEYEIGRSDLILNLGGGVITDMGGFIASTYKRGIPFINIPTTLLAQVDASVGGKTGIDLGPYKNQIGVFSEPEVVYIDSAFLSTLADQELISGYAEMIKHGLIQDANYWNELITIDPVNSLDQLLQLTEKSVDLKRAIVQRDPKESGERKLLNFGHTIGHAFEGYCLIHEIPITHGNAVAWGMVAEGFLSLEHGLSIGELNEIKYHVQRLFPFIPIGEEAIPELMKLILNDKKNEDGIVKFTLLSSIGKGIYNLACDEEEIRNAFHLVLNHEE